MFRRQLRARGDSCCFINWRSVDVYVVSPLARSRLFGPLPDSWCFYEFSRLLIVLTSIVMAYYSNVVIRQPAQELNFRTAVSELSVWGIMFYFLSALTDGPVGFSSDFTGVKVIAARSVLLHLPESAHNFINCVEVLLDHVPLYCQSCEVFSRL